MVTMVDHDTVRIYAESPANVRSDGRRGTVRVVVIFVFVESCYSLAPQ
jgi:hypothetical protein